MQPELLSVPEQLLTARLVVRRYQAGDAAAYWAAIEESRAHLRPWLRHAPGLQSLDEVRVELAHYAADWHTRERLGFGIFEREVDRFVGEAVFHHNEWNVPALSLGYWLRASAEAHGFMREALAALCTMGLHELGALRIEARLDTRNTRSRRVLQALGFAHEGTMLRSARDALGEVIDVDLFALVRP